MKNAINGTTHTHIVGEGDYVARVNVEHKPSLLAPEQSYGTVDVAIWGESSMLSDGCDLALTGMAPCEADKMLTALIATLTGQRDAVLAIMED